MIESLRSQWQEDLSFDAIIVLRDGMDAMLQRIRSEGAIRLPVVRCPHCGRMGEAAALHVSVRAMILSLIRFGISPSQQVYPLEKGWAVYRKQHGLDLYGKAVDPAAVRAAGCAHRQRPS
jgi:hypothetical protein